MMIHDGSNLEEISELKEGSNILKGGSAEAGLILSPLGRAMDDLSQRPAFEPSVGNKEEKKKEMLENIDKCQGDLFKLLEEYQNTIKRIEENGAYKVGKSLVIWVVC